MAQILLAAVFLQVRISMVRIWGEVGILENDDYRSKLEFETHVITFLWMICGREDRFIRNSIWVRYDID